MPFRYGCFSGLERLLLLEGYWFRHMSHPRKDHGWARRRYRCCMGPPLDSKAQGHSDYPMIAQIRDPRSRLMKHLMDHGEHHCGFGLDRLPPQVHQHRRHSQDVHSSRGL